MKIQTTVLAVIAATVGAASAANIAVGGAIGDITIGSGNHWQGNGVTTDINSGVTVTITNPTWETILQQNSDKTSTWNINGGTVDASGATGNGVKFWLANTGGDTGIINMNGGLFDGSGLTEFIFGRGGATGEFNIAGGSVIIGDSTPEINANDKLNFTAGSTGSFEVTGWTSSDYEALWNDGKLTYAGGNSGDFTDHFNVNGSTLTAVPEPSSAALLGLGGLALILRRRK